MASSQVPRALLFDFDGTLADGYDGIRASVNHVRAAAGLPPWDDAEVRAAVGNGLERLLELAVPAGPTPENLRLYSEHHETALETGTRLLPGVAETLAKLKAAGVKLAICSNKPLAFTLRLLPRLGLDAWIDVALGPESVPRRKPAPDMLLAAAEQLGVPLADTAYVGDMTIDIAAARAAGLPAWVLATGSHDAPTLRAAGPDRFLDDFRELASLSGAD